ncbi:MAG: hypothetical protein KAJ06_12270, partial [Gammaproteobacteria bacterium]|nr:hypothetical protein [Gammaproteobacteria bacterium]
GYGIRDNSGTIQVKNLSGAWTDIGAGATAFNDLNDVDVSGVSLGNLIYYSSLGWSTTSTSTLGIALSDTTGTLAVNKGGTGLSLTPNYGQILLGNSSNGYTLVSTSSLGLAGLSASGTIGQIPFFNSDGDTLTATSVIYIDTATGFVGIATTTPGKRLTVAGTGQFNELCFDDGSCISNWSSAGGIDATSTILAGQVAVWHDSNTLTGSSTLMTNVGGTGKSTWTPLAIPYLQGTTTFGEINIGSSSHVLAINATGDGYEWVEASSTGVVLSQEEVEDYVGAMVQGNTETLITVTYENSDGTLDFVVQNNLNSYDWSNIGITHLTSARGGTGWNSSTTTGVALINDGVWGSSSTLPVHFGGTGWDSTSEDG